VVLSKLETKSFSPIDLLEGMRNGHRRALADALTLLEDTGVTSGALVDAMRESLNGVPVLGITGPPGAGKSTLINALTGIWRGQGKRIAIIAVDPSSPVSGGAILGDRIRMTAALNDAGVFVRSLASHGHLGGLSPAAVRLIDAFDVAGFDLVLLETVGTGQNEVDIASIADVGVVMAAPGLGDGVQAMKSGLLEIADVLVVNKGDRADARETAQQLQAAVSLREGIGRTPEVFLTTATTGDGVETLAGHILELASAEQALSTAQDRRLQRGRYVLERLAVEHIRGALTGAASSKSDALVEDFMSGRCDTTDALRRLFGAC